ncbi:MAG: hypothetical protein QNJ77_08345 [Acidimicrobiia bacterium]|nr:hypothetical protein [Acidimicrobiia bacterium]
MATLLLETAAGGVLGTVAPLALGAAAGTALVVDLDENGPPYPGEGSLASLVEDGPRLAELRPARRGVAVLRNGGVGYETAAEVVAALAAGWPNVVLRGAPGIAQEDFPVVPVVPLLPGGMTAVSPRAAVYQQVGWNEKAPGPAVVLPTPSRRVVAALLTGTVPMRNRWIAAWRRVWELPWV